MHEALIVLLVVLVGVAISWKVVAVVVVFWVSLPLRAKAARKWPPGLSPRWYRTAVDLAMSSLLYAIVGGLLFGGLGAIFGFVVGTSLALSSIPLSVKSPKDGERLPLTLQNSPGTAKAMTIAGLASPAVLLLACVLLYLAR